MHVYNLQLFSRRETHADDWTRARFRSVVFDSLLALREKCYEVDT